MCGNGATNGAPPWRLARRRLLDFLLVYIAEGEGAFEVDAQRWDARPGDLFSIPAVASISGLSPSHFSRVFGLLFGCSPRAFQRRSRVAKAKQLMLGSTLNVSQISQMVGFATVHSFSRAFASVEGVPPTRYRASAAGAEKGPPRAHRFLD